MSAEMNRSRVLRRALAPALLVLGLAWGGVKIYNSWPRQVTVTVKYRQGDGGVRQVVYLSVADADRPERPISNVLIQPTDGEPGEGEQRHSWRLAPGDYLVTCELAGAVTRRQSRKIEVREGMSIFFEF